MKKFRSCLLVGLVALSLAACGDSGPTLCEVEGTVTLDGQPVPNAELTFIPQNVPATMVSYGQTDDKGHYSLAFTATKTGAIPATHHVRIETSGGMKLPKKYKGEGSVTADVKKRHNVIDLKLTKD